MDPDLAKVRAVEYFECTSCLQAYPGYIAAAACYDKNQLKDYLSDYDWDENGECPECEHGKEHHYQASSTADPYGDLFLFCGICKKGAAVADLEVLNCQG